MIRTRRNACLVILAIFIAIHSNVIHAAEPRRHEEKAGGFSFIPPDGWTMRELPGMKYKLAVGPIEGNFAANINTVDENFEGSLKDYVKNNIETIRHLFKDFKLIKQDDFKTESGIPGTRVVIEDKQGDINLRQTFFFLAKGSKKFVVTCSVKIEGGDKLDQAFEKCLMTWKFEKQ